MIDLPTVAHYHEVMKERYDTLVRNQNIVKQRLRKTIIDEFNNCDHGRKFVEELYSLGPVEGIISTTYFLKNPVDVADIIDDLRSFFKEDDQDYKVHRRLYGLSGDLLGIRKLSITLGCWIIIPTVNNKNIDKVTMWLETN